MACSFATNFILIKSLSLNSEGLLMKTFERNLGRLPRTAFHLSGKYWGKQALTRPGDYADVKAGEELLLQKGHIN